MHGSLLFRTIDRIASALAVAAGIAVAVLAFLIVIDIVGRSLFRLSLQGTDELGGYTLALVGSLGFSNALLRRGHPRIDIFLKFFPLRVRAVLHVVAYISLASFAVFMTWHALTEFQQTLLFNTLTNTPLQTPLWAPQSIWIFGTGFFALVCVICALDSLRLLTKDAELTERTYGPPSVDEEVEEYLSHDPAATTGKA